MFKTTRFKSSFYILKLGIKSKPDRQIEMGGVTFCDNNDFCL